MNAHAIPTPKELLDRWDAQQTAYIKHRDQRFAVMVDAIARLRGDTPRILDLACGPGSLSAALLARLPQAQIVAVDKDPVLLRIASDVFAGQPNVSVRSVDLDLPDCLGDLGGPLDAVVSSTALHWLAPDVLARLYFQVARLVPEDGLFLNADHLLYDPVATPTFRELARRDDEHNQHVAFSSGTDTWDGWWDAAQSRPDYAEAVQERAGIWEGKAAPLKVTLGFHIEALRSAGFRQVGTLWQYLDDYVVCAVK